MEEKIYQTTAFSLEEKGITKKSLLTKLEALIDEFTDNSTLSEVSIKVIARVENAVNPTVEIADSLASVLRGAAQACL